MKKYMVDKVKAINFDRMDSLAKIISERTGKNKNYIKKDMFKNFIKYGIGYTDYFKSDYINLTEEEKKTHLTSKNYVPILNYLNKKEYRFATNDKIIFNQIFQKYIGRDYIDLRNASEKEFKDFVNKYKTVFAKRRADFGGHGIRKLESKNIKNYKELYNDLLKTDTVLIEEEIKQHEILKKLNPYAVNTLRIISIYKKGKVHILKNAFRLNITDETAITCADAFAPVDLNGKFLTDITDDAGVYYKEHPVTKVKFKDCKIPYVKEAYQMIEDAHKLIPDIRYIGWDVAITNDGPIILEGNEYPSYGLIQYYMISDPKHGHLEDIKNVLGDEWNNIKF